MERVTRFYFRDLKRNKWIRVYEYDSEGGGYTHTSLTYVDAIDKATPLSADDPLIKQEYVGRYQTLDFVEVQVTYAIIKSKPHIWVPKWRCVHKTRPELVGEVVEEPCQITGGENVRVVWMTSPRGGIHDLVNVNDLIRLKY